MTPANERALAQLWRDHHTSVLHTVRRRVFDEAQAEDITSEVFLRLARALERGIKDPAEKIPLFIHGLLANEARDSERRPVPMGDRFDLVAQVGAWGATQFLEQGQAFFPPAFDAAVREQAEEDRDAYILTDLRGLDLREAGAVLGVSYPTAMRRADRARTRIRKEMP